MKINRYTGYNSSKRHIDGRELLNKKVANKEIVKPKQEDILQISQKGKKIPEDFSKKIEDKKQLLEMLEENRINADKESKMDIKTKCFKIYLRIVRGDRVPAKDKRFLAKHEPGLYTNAMLFRKYKDKPKKHKSLVKDEENDDRIESKKLLEQDKIHLATEEQEPELI